MSTKRDIYKIRCKKVSNAFTSYWFNNIGKYLFNNDNNSESIQKWSNIMNDQLDKLKKRDINDKNIRDKSEKKRLTKMYNILLEKSREDAKLITNGLKDWSSIPVKYDITTSYIFDQEVDAETVNKIYEIVNRFSNMKEFLDDLATINNPYVDNLSKKIYRMIMSKRKSEVHEKKNVKKKKNIQTKECKKKKKSSNKSSVQDKPKKLKSKRVETEEQRKKRKDNAKRFEDTVQDILDSIGIPRSEYRTEDQLAEENMKAAKSYKAPVHYRTPDFYFLNSPIKINGNIIKWIDCKNCVIFDGLSDDVEVSLYLNQINDYCRLFGPGLIIYHRPYLSTTKNLYEYPKMVHHAMIKFHSR